MDFGGDHFDMQRNFYGPCVEDNMQDAETVIQLRNALEEILSALEDGATSKAVELTEAAIKQAGA